ncbi:PAAR-like domain-containing protein [Bowmanella denitrificans]|uniref:PAAR-like domain-containing protein n=1 Tax=Bowmanella denitrificans TaxID=366582 RepID=UPI000C9CE71C|nr:PAAR-like domain-containing protein [Bowmanella denitrificans]
MGNKVYANGREIACKAGSGKVIAAFPDVCFTPPDKVPPTPPGVPIPYPLFSKNADTTKGTKKVTIGGKEVMKRDDSNFKTCNGDEAGSTAKKGIINGKLTGKVYFTSWSMNVKVEGKNVVRHLDLTTSNHSSPNANAAVPWAHVATQSVNGNSCKAIVAEIHPYDKADCPSGSQSHHIIDNACFVMPGARSMALKNIESSASGQAKRNIFQPGSGHPGEKYNQNKAPCICLEGEAKIDGTEHNIAHGHTSRAAKKKCSADGKSKFKDLKSDGAKSIKKAKGLESWEEECIKLVIDSHFKDFKDDTELPAPGQSCSASHFSNGKGKDCQASELIDI